jgi:Tol biopolymer transport system component
MQTSSVLMLSAGLVLCGGAASAQCSFTAQGTTAPALPGRVVYENADTGRLYLYDFAAHHLTQLNTVGWGVTGALNPVFSPDGSAILFTAVANNERDLYYWVIGAATPTNITAAFPNTRNEDPKFSPDGTKIVWKQTFSIEQANLVFNGSGTPSLTGAVQLVLGHQGMSDEASAPVYSPTQKYIYYYTGTGSGAQVQQYNTQTATHGPAFTMQPNTEYYYPVDPDYYEFFYTSWLTPTNTFDKIYLYSRVTQTATVFNPTDCAANNSDPAPVDEDYFLYSRDDNPSGNRYELYLGQLSTGNAWLLPSPINGSSGNFLGANYTNARP